MGIGAPRIVEHTHTFNMGDVDKLAKELTDAIIGQPVPLVEQAMLWGYINVAPGVKQYPKASRLDRACLLLHLVSADVVERMQKVGALSDAEVQAGLEAASRRTM